MPARKSSLLKPLKPKPPPKSQTLQQLIKKDAKIPRQRKGKPDPDIVAAFENAIAGCYCLDITYPDKENPTGSYTLCPTAIGLKDGRVHALGMQVRTDGDSASRDPEFMCLFVAGVEAAVPSELNWISTPGDLAKATCFDPGRITQFSTCPADPPRDNIRLWRR